MSDSGLFSKEEAVARAARAQLEQNQGLDGASSEELLSAYSKLLRTAKRLMRHSDSNERALRNANEAVKHKNDELEGLSSRLSKFLSPQLYDRLFESQNSVALASERKRLTVMFSDLVGFTDLSDQLEPEELTGVLNSYLEAMAELIEDYGGTFDKFLGDGMMVFFGDPTSKGAKEDALACVQMGLAMQERLNELRQAWRKSGLPDTVSCRIGIHTGYCTVGNFGSKDRMDYTIIGSAVNLAARLESQAEPNAILVSKSTQSLLSEEIAFETLEPLTLKGFARPIEAFRVLGKSSRDRLIKAEELVRQAQILQSIPEGTAREAAIAEVERLLEHLKSASGED